MSSRVDKDFCCEKVLYCICITPTWNKIIHLSAPSKDTKNFFSTQEKIVLHNNKVGYHWLASVDPSQEHEEESRK